MLASTRDADLLDTISVEFLTKPSILVEPSWMDTIVTYLKTGKQLEDKIEARILRLKVARYVLYDNKLYRRGYSMPFLKCATPCKSIIHHEEDPRRYMCEPCWGTVLSIQGSKARLLPANHESRLH